MIRKKSQPGAWTMGSQLLPTAQIELESGDKAKPSECQTAPWKTTSKVLPTIILESVDPSPLRYRIQLTWLNDVNGHATPIQHQQYFPTARFVDEVDQFSVALELSETSLETPTSGTLRLLNPDLRGIQRRLHPGAALEIMEGPRVVAHCVVESLIHAVAAAAYA